MVDARASSMDKEELVKVRPKRSVLYGKQREELPTGLGAQWEEHSGCREGKPRLHISDFQLTVI